MTPTNVNLGSVTSPMTAGRFAPDAAGYHALLDLIAAQPGNTFAQLSLNRYDSCWPHPDLANTGANAAGILYAWPSAAWDHVNHRFIAWGGGHANSSSNEPYVWDATTRRWRLAFLPSEYVSLPPAPNGNSYSRSADFNASAVSAHTYHNNVYLPVLGLFATFGGATQGPGRYFEVWDEGDPAALVPLRPAGCFTLDLDKHGLNFVGGKTGAHAHRNTTVGVNHHGARAWQLRDWYGFNPGLTMLADHRNCGAAVAQEGGRDVAYFTVGSPGSQRRVWRAEFAGNNPANDILTLVLGQLNDPSGGLGSLALDPVKRILLSIQGGAGPLQWLDLKGTLGASTGWTIMSQSAMSGDVAAFASGTDGFVGLCFDTRRNRFLAYNYGPDVYEITPPAGNPTPTAGWTVTKRTAASGSYPPLNLSTDGMNGSHLCGLWRYAPDLGCALAVHEPGAGEVWAYKPIGWTDPRI